MQNPQHYSGFEQGPIRPPSEAQSLLIRVTRNCPWNKCNFCPVFKGTKFSLRPLAHVLADIEAVHRAVESIRETVADRGQLSQPELEQLAGQFDGVEHNAFYAALSWFHAGQHSIFLQDANSLIYRPDDLIAVLKKVRSCFPGVRRITSYARSHTVNKIDEDKLRTMAEMGLNRIHIGLESGSDKVLALTQKGVTKDQHVAAGQKVKRAGMELSEYVMPGLGGREFSNEHALETADAINQINPDFIRLRTLAVHPETELFELEQSGEFRKCGERESIQEIHDFITQLDGISSTLKSDHMLNLFQEVEGSFPGDKAHMLATLKEFLDLPPLEQMLFQVGRRVGLFGRQADLYSSMRRERVEIFCKQHSIRPDNVDHALESVMRSMIR